MTTDTTIAGDSGHAEVIRTAKSDWLPSELDPMASVGGAVAHVDGVIPWPISPLALMTLYLASPEHQRCIHLKAEGACGRGVEGSRAGDFRALWDNPYACVDVAIDLDTYGAAFVQVVRGHDDRPVACRRLPSIHMARTTRGYRQKIQGPDGRDKITTFRADEIVMLRRPGPMGHFYGLPTWVSAAGMMGLAKAATEYNAKYFENNAIPDYVFTVKGGQLTEPQKIAAREFFRRDFKGLDNAHKTLFLAFDSGDVSIELKPVGRDTKDGDFLQLLDASRERIHVAHGVPPRMLGIMSAGRLGGGGDEVRSQFEVFELLTLAPLRRHILAGFAPLLSEIGIDPFDADQLSFTPLPMPGAETAAPADAPADEADAAPETPALSRSRTSDLVKMLEAL